MSNGEDLKRSVEEQTEAEKVLGSMPSYEEHMKQRSKGEKAQRLLELAGVSEIRKNEELFDEKIQEMTVNGAYKYLTTLNGILRGVDKKRERGRRDNITVGDHVAPSADVQKVIMDDTVKALKNIKDNHYRATLAYYTVNYLHLFPDGNGRTSRAVYEIFDNDSFDLNSDDFIHRTDSQDEVGGHQGFERSKGICQTIDAYSEAREHLLKSLAAKGLVDKRMAEMPSHIQIIGDVYLTEDAKNGLSSREKYTLRKAFNDQQIATVALAGMLGEKGVAKEVIDNCINDDGKREICFEVEDCDMETGKPNEEAAKIFQGWSADDYRRFLNSCKNVQRWNQQVLNGFFVRPDQYKTADGQRIADLLSRVK